MIREEKKYGWCHEGLRQRYRPKAKICRGLINAAPWLDVVLLIAFFIALTHRLVLRPGVVVDLPVANAVTGTRDGHKVVVLMSGHLGPGESGETVFFDDVPFVVDDESQMADLASQIGTAAGAFPGVPLIIEADAGVRHGTIVSLCNMAAEAAIPVVNLAAGEPGSQDGE